MKTKPLYLLAALSLSCAITSCTAITEKTVTGIGSLTKNPKSFKTKGEVITVTSKLKKKKSVSARKSAIAKSGIVPFSLPPVVATAVAGYVADGFQSGVDKASKNYAAVWSHRHMGRNLNLSTIDGFTVTRRVKSGTAAELEFSYVDGGSGYYSLALDRVNLVRSKAMVPFYDGDIDLLITVEIKVMTDKGYKTAISYPYKVSSVKLGEDKSFPKMDSEGKLLLNRTHQSAWFGFPSVSTPYELTISVQETSNFAAVAERGAKLLESNNDKLAKALAEALAGKQ